MKDLGKIKKAMILLKIFSVLLLGCVVGYIIYNYIKNNTIDVWCFCIAIFLAFAVVFIYFTKIFMVGPKAKRNRILLYVFIPLACVVPSVLNIVCKFTTGSYTSNTDVVSMIDSGMPLVFVAILWCLIIVLLYGAVCAFIAIYIEKSIVPKNEEMIEGIKAKMQIELQKQKEENTKQTNKKK